MENLFIELTQKEKENINGGGIEYKWIYVDGEVVMISINVKESVNLTLT